MGEQNSIDVAQWNAVFHQLQTGTVAGIYQPYLSPIVSAVACGSLAVLSKEGPPFGAQ